MKKITEGKDGGGIRGNFLEQMVRLMETRQSSRTAFWVEGPASAKALRQFLRQKEDPYDWSTARETI